MPANSRRRRNRGDDSGETSAAAMVHTPGGEVSPCTLQIVQMLQAPELPKFSGDEDVENFIREAKLMLKLHPMPDGAAAGWLFGALQGRAKKLILSREAEELDSPEKIFSILEQDWGQQQEAPTLAAAFFDRQQGLAESASEYAAALRILWAKTNAAQADTLSPAMLCGAFVNGLHHPSLQRDLRRFLRNRPGSTFQEVTRETQCWLRDDGDQDTTTQQTAAIDPGVSHRLEAQTATLVTEDAVTKQMPREQRDPAASSPGTPTRQTSRRRRGHKPHGPGQHNLTCWWCQRQGHREADCRAKQSYQQRAHCQQVGSRRAAMKEPRRLEATVTRLQAQLTTLRAEIASLKGKLQQCATPLCGHSPATDLQDPRPDPPFCLWCQKRGHKEEGCRLKRRHSKKTTGLEEQTAERGQCKQAVVNSLKVVKSSSPVKGPCTTAGCVEQPVQVPGKRWRRQRRRRPAGHPPRCKLRKRMPAPHVPPLVGGAELTVHQQHLPATVPSDQCCEQYQTARAPDSSCSSGYESVTELVPVSVSTPVPVLRSSLQPDMQE